MGKVRTVKEPGKEVGKYKDLADEPFLLVEEAALGIPASAVNEMVGMTRLSKEYFAGILDLSTRTLDRYQKEKKKLNQAGSELILKMISVFKLGEKVFGNNKEFRRWLESPAYGLGNRKPLDLMHSSTGMDLLKNELSRIAFGDLA